MALRQLAAAALLCSALACSKSTGSAPSICGTRAPVASAAASPASVEPVVGTVALTASSTDADDACLPAPEARTYLWTVYARPAGSSAVVVNPIAAATAFTPDVPGTYQLEVVATDAAGHQSLPAFTTVTASACSLLAPTIALPAAASGTVFNPVALPAPTVSDLNCLSDGAVTYTWTLTSRPPAGSAVLTAPTAAAPSFTPDAIGPWQASVVVRNSRGIASEPAYLTVDVATCGSAVPALPALAASPAAPSAGDLVGLGLAGPITDPNEAGCAMHVLPYRYRWTMISRPVGSGAALAGGDTGAPAFVPDVPGGAYQVALTVTDALGNASAPAFLTLQASDCGARRYPAAFSVSNPTPNAFAATALLATPTSDPSLLPPVCPARFQSPAGSCTYTWRVLDQPLGSHPSISPSSGLSAAFQSDAAGPYVVELAVTGPGGLTGTAQQVINVSSCGTNPPAASNFVALQAGGPATGSTLTGGTWSAITPLDAGLATTLTATVSDADNLAACGSMGQAVTYAWSLVESPPGSAATLWNPATSAPSLVPDLPGSYQVKLQTTDPLGNASTAAFQFGAGPCGSHAPVVSAISAYQPLSGILVTGAGSPPTVLARDAIGLSATASDPDTLPGCGLPQTLRYAWTLVQAPPGSLAQLVRADTATPAFTPDLASPTPYVVAVVVTDDQGHASAQATLSITAL